MYPFVRMIKELAIHRNAPPLPLTGTHVSRLTCWPWDIDLWMELNNGRSLTLYDLGRIPLAGRVGLIKVLRRKRWGLTMAGCSVRWRARVRTFETVEIRSRCVGWDDRFVYIEQSMWKKDGRCASHVMYRSAVTDRNGIVAPERVMQELGVAGVEAPELPAWVRAWIDADAGRPWPPMAGDEQALSGPERHPA
jgi:acyl-CoA thioesterase FadM